MQSIDLFCLPYAGGSAKAIYGKWVQQLEPWIELKPLELAGHGKRMAEPFASSVQSAVEDLLDTMHPQITERPYAIYAHSMGTILAYELTVAIRSAGLPEPCVLFLSGRQPPHYKYEDKGIHKLPDDAFLNEIRSMGGTPGELFEMKELLKLFLPVLRNDYRIIENYRFQEPVQSVCADLVYFFSDDDSLVGKPSIYEWDRYTSRAFEFHEFQGGHFFLNENWVKICSVINQKLRLMKQK